MPNFELHGFDEELEANSIRRKLFAICEECGVPVKDVVVTVYPTKVTDRTGQRRPFIRLVTTPDVNIIKLISWMKKLNRDTEVCYLAAFYPSK